MSKKGNSESAIDDFAHIVLPKTEDKSMDAILDREKNQNRIDALVVSECGKKCFRNFKNEKIEEKENICMSSCVLRYYDSLMIGEKLFDLFQEKQLDTKSLLTGDYYTFSQSAYQKI